MSGNSYFGAAIQDSTVIAGIQAARGAKVNFNFSNNDGEIHGKDNLLDTLPHPADAPHDSYWQRHEPTCLGKTRIGFLQELEVWAKGEDARRIFWLSGLAGTGKSTIARTLARTCSKEKRLGASFFFARGREDIGRARMFITSIAYQLAISIPCLDQHIRDAIGKRRDIAQKSPLEQWEHLVLQPLSKLNGSDCRFPYVVVIDALDECDDVDDIRVILHLLSGVRSLRWNQLRIFLTSRPEIAIRGGFTRIADTEYQSFALHTLPPPVVEQDILFYLKYHLKKIGQEDLREPSWPTPEVVHSLTKMANNLFIWAATACRFIRGGVSADERLQTILKGSSAPATPEERLDTIYTTVLRNSVQLSYTEREDPTRFCALLREALSSIAILFLPLSAESLNHLLFSNNQDILRILKHMHAIIDIRGDTTHPLHLHHPSFRDFLFDLKRCRDLNFWVDEKQAHQRLAIHCLQLMDTTLREDGCGIGRLGALVTDVEPEHLQQYLSPEVRYACLYWIQHLERSDFQLSDKDQVHQFLHAHLLHWVEALSWLRRTSEVINGIISLEAIISTYGSPLLFKFVHDTKRFLLYNRWAIEHAPLQTYYSALLFAPNASLVKQRFQGQLPWMQRLQPVEDDWKPLLLTFESHTDEISALAFSPVGNLVASASIKHDVMLWDAASGSKSHVLEGHSDTVMSLVFSQDGKLLASASEDMTVVMWDTKLGAVLKIFKSHTKDILALAFLPDDKLLAMGYDCDLLKLWDVGSETTFITQRYSDSIEYAIFSPDRKLLALGLTTGIISLWEIRSEAVIRTLEGHLDSITGLAFSSNGKLLASASYDTARLWVTESGVLLHVIDCEPRSIYGIALSPDSKLLALGLDDGTVSLWHIALGVKLQPLERHSEFVTCIAFSPDGKLLASGSGDCLVYLWDITSRTHPQIANEHLDSPESSASLLKQKGHSQSVRAVTFSPNGKLLATGSHDKTVILWNTRLRTRQQTFDGHSSAVFSVAFSPDGKLLASGSEQSKIRVWDIESKKIRRAFDCNGTAIVVLTFSPNGELLASAMHSEIILWAMGSEIAPKIVKVHSSWVRDVKFSPDCKVLVSAFEDNRVMLWDIDSEKVLHTFSMCLDSISFVALSLGDKLFELEFDPLVGLLSLSEDENASPDGTGRSDSVTRLRRTSLHIIVHDQWVRYKNENILWLPPEYRPGDFDVCEGTLCIGCANGKVLFLDLSL